MTSKSYARVLDSVLALKPRWRAAAVRGIAIALAGVFLSYVLSWTFDVILGRSVIVSANTSRFDLEISELEATLDLRGAALCLPRQNPSRDESATVDLGCGSSRAILLKSGDKYPEASMVRLPEASVAAWPVGGTVDKNFVLSLPQGTSLRFEAMGERIEISVTKIPAGYWVPPGSRLLMQSAEFEDLGRFAVRGRLTLGTAPGRSSRGSLAGGKVEFRWHTLFSYSANGPTSVMLREEELPRATRVHFENPKAPADMEVLFALTSRPDGPGRRRSWFEIDAVNHPAPTVVIVEQAGVRQLRLGPIWTDVLLNEPILLLAALLGGAIGLGALRRALRRLMEHGE